jgi:hypothetical protein
MPPSYQCVDALCGQAAAAEARRLTAAAAAAGGSHRAPRVRTWATRRGPSGTSPGGRLMLATQPRCRQTSASSNAECTLEAQQIRWPDYLASQRQGVLVTRVWAVRCGAVVGRGGWPQVSRTAGAAQPPAVHLDAAVTTCAASATRARGSQNPEPTENSPGSSPMLCGCIDDDAAHAGTRRWRWARWYATTWPLSCRGKVAQPIRYSCSVRTPRGNTAPAPCCHRPTTPAS